MNKNVEVVAPVGHGQMIAGEDEYTTMIEILSTALRESEAENALLQAKLVELEQELQIYKEEYKSMSAFLNKEGWTL